MVETSILLYLKFVERKIQLKSVLLQGYTHIKYYIYVCIHTIYTYRYIDIYEICYKDTHTHNIYKDKQVISIFHSGLYVTKPSALLTPKSLKKLSMWLITSRNIQKEQNIYSMPSYNSQATCSSRLYYPLLHANISIIEAHTQLNLGVNPRFPASHSTHVYLPFAKP